MGSIPGVVLNEESITFSSGELYKIIRSNERLHRKYLQAYMTQNGFGEPVSRLKLLKHIKELSELEKIIMNIPKELW